MIKKVSSVQYYNSDHKFLRKEMMLGLIRILDRLKRDLSNDPRLGSRVPRHFCEPVESLS